MTRMPYDTWLDDVRAALDSVNMPMDDWQKVWPFDFRKAFDAGTAPNAAAAQANRYWWQKQDVALKE